MIVVSSALSLSAAFALESHLPVIGWQSLATVDNVTADSEQDGYPATNLANPSTVLLWKSDSAAVQYITVAHDSLDQLDYIAVARHNFGSSNISVTVQTLSGDEDATWTDAVAEQFLADDRPALFRFTPENGASIRLKLDPTGADTPAKPQAAVLYTGKLLVSQRSVQTGFVPLHWGRRRTIIGNRSEDGEYLGQVQTGESLASSVAFSNFEPEWFRTNFEPFLEEAPPFFFAWHPLSYPAEVGFAWMTDDPSPSLGDYAGRVNIALQMEGLAL